MFNVQIHQSYHTSWQLKLPKKRTSITSKLWGDHFAVGIFPVSKKHRHGLKSSLDLSSSLCLFSSQQLLTSYPSSHNHGSVENGCISNISFLSFRVVFHWTMIMGERVTSLLINKKNMDADLTSMTHDGLDLLSSLTAQDEEAELWRCDLSKESMVMTIQWSMGGKSMEIISVSVRVKQHHHDLTIASWNIITVHGHDHESSSSSSSNNITPHPLSTHDYHGITLFVITLQYMHQLFLHLHSPRLNISTYHEAFPKRKLIFQSLCFRCFVSFREITHNPYPHHHETNNKKHTLLGTITYPQFWVDDFPNFPFGGIWIRSLEARPIKTAPSPEIATHVLVDRQPVWPRPSAKQLGLGYYLPTKLGNVGKFGLSPFPVIVEMKVYRDSLLKM